MALNNEGIEGETINTHIQDFSQTGVIANIIHNTYQHFCRVVIKGSSVTRNTCYG